MELDLLIDVVLWWITGYIIARLVFEWIEYKLSQQFEKEIAPIVRDLDSGKLIPLTVELHNNQFLCYNSITNDFVCQGETLLELAQRFGSRYPDRRATIHRGDTEVIAKLKQQLRDDVKNISLVAR